MSINVYCYDNGYIAPLEVTNEGKEKHVDLLYLKDNAHDRYCLIQSLSRLVRSKVTKHKEKTFLCKMCLNHFCSEEKL
jgi:ribosomal protein S8